MCYSPVDLEGRERRVEYSPMLLVFVTSSLGGGSNCSTETTTNGNINFRNITCCSVHSLCFMF